MPPSEATTATETGLGIAPCHYWYLLHAEATFGQTVFLWSATIDSWQENEGGLCPFDSGGLWHGHIVTDPPLATMQARKMFFDRYNQALPGWDESFRLHLATSYGSAGDYIRGQAPQTGVPEIVKGLPNTSRAWAWEARVCRDTPLIARLTLESVYWTEPDRDNFDLWLEGHDFLDDSQLEQIQAWSLAHSRPCARGESPALVATADLIARFGS